MAKAFTASAIIPAIVKVVVSEESNDLNAIHMGLGHSQQTRWCCKAPQVPFPEPRSHEDT